MRSPWFQVFSLCAWVALACACAPDEQGLLERALVGRGRVAWFGAEPGRAWQPNGVQLEAVAANSPIGRGLAGEDPAALIASMVELGFQGVLLDLRGAAQTAGLAAQMTRYARIEGLQGAYFDHGAALYVLDPVRVWSPGLRKGLALVARRLLAGDTPPQLRSFPEAVRRLDPVEVMVLLRKGEDPRLWRSARGSSFARAMLTATAVARQRWIERAAALGGRINDLLPTLTVELSLLQDDGELGARNQPFIDRVITVEHGVGYERKGGWHYLLPEATHHAGRAPTRAYQQLFTDDGLPSDSIDNRELRLYRLAVQRIGVSAPEDDGLSNVADPGEVLER